jgi:hypothetical protein
MRLGANPTKLDSFADQLIQILEFASGFSFDDKVAQSPVMSSCGSPCVTLEKSAGVCTSRINERVDVVY